MASSILPLLRMVGHHFKSTSEGALIRGGGAFSCTYDIQHCCFTGDEKAVEDEKERIDAEYECHIMVDRADSRLVYYKYQ